MDQTGQGNSAATAPEAAPLDAAPPAAAVAAPPVDLSQIDQLHRSTDGSERVAVLDGIRTCAALLVFFGHATQLSGVTPLDSAFRRLFSLNGLGATTFFMLSGFLITEALLKANRTPKYYFRNFYARRAIRLLPMYYLLLLFGFAVRPLLTPLLGLKPAVMPDHPWLYWFGLTNFAVAETGWFRTWNVDITWSLAIEFQFYLIWPVVVYLLSPRGIAKLGLLMFAVSFVYRVLAAFVWNTPPIEIYVSSVARMGAFGTGAFVAVALRDRNLLLRLRPWATTIAVTVLPVIWLTMMYEDFFAADWLRYPEQRDVRGGRITVSLLNSWMLIGISAFFIRVLAASPEGRLHSVFGCKPLRTFAKYSYGFFLLHTTVILALYNRVWAPQAYPSRTMFRWPIILGSEIPSQLAFYLLAFGITLVLAFIAWHCYEKQWLKLSRYFPSRPPASKPVPGEARPGGG